MSATLNPLVIPPRVNLLTDLSSVSREALSRFAGASPETAHFLARVVLVCEQASASLSKQRAFDLTPDE